MPLERLTGEALAGLASALEAAGLRAHDLDQPGHRFYRLEAGGVTVGYAGLEICGPDGLLRSVVSTVYGVGFGRRVVEATVEEARRLGVERLWLLTETAEEFFRRMGFKPADRSAAPSAIAATEQFASLCPAAAVFMKRDIC